MDALLRQRPKEYLKQILEQSPSERTEDDIDEIMKLVGDVKFLKQFKDTPQLRELCRFMRMKSYGVRQSVFEQGDEGDAFYIIFSGRVSVYVKVVSQITGNVNLKHVAELQKGDSFGQLALIYGAKRAASIITSQTTDLIVLDKPVYDREIKGLQVDQIDTVIEYFKHFSIFQDISKEVLINISTKSLYRKYPSNTIVVRQGDIPRAVFFIKSGRCKVIRKVDFLKSKKVVTKQSLHAMIQDPKEEHYDEEGRVESKLLEIDQLVTGDCFGDQAIFSKEPMSFSVVSIIPMEMFVLDEHDFLQLDKKILQEFRSFNKPYPSDYELRKALFEMKQWQDFKKSMVTNVRAEKKNKRWDFDHQLRKKQQIPKKLTTILNEDDFKDPKSHVTHRNPLLNMRTKFISNSDLIKD